MGSIAGSSDGAPPGGRYGAALAVCAANLLAYFPIGIVVPVLPLYMRGVLAASDMSIGVVMGSYAVTTLAGRPWGGHWGDRVGYRRPAATGTFLILVGTAVYGLFESTPWLLACRLVVGFGEGLTQSACIAWAVSLAPARRQGAILSYAGVSGWVGVALGALAGDAVLARGGYTAAFGAGVITPAAGLVLLALLPTTRAAGRSRVSVTGIARSVLRQGAAYTLVSVGYAAVLTFGTLLLRSRGSASPSLLLNSFAAGVIGVRVVAGDLPSRLGPARTAAICAGAQAAGTAIVAADAAHPAGVALAGIGAGMGFGLCFPSLALDVLGRVPEDNRGVAIGTVSAFFDVALALSGVVLGAIAERRGYAAAFAFSALCAAAGAGLLLPLVRAAPAPQPDAPQPGK